MGKANIREALKDIDEHWSQRVLGEANGQLFKVAKGYGSTNWHTHEDQDELFIVYSGKLTIEFRDSSVELQEQDLFVVPRGHEHRTVADGEAEFLVAGRSITSNAAGGKP